MHLLAAVHHAANSGTGSQVTAGIIIVAVVITALVLFGWRPFGRSRKVRHSPAAAAVKATGRGASRMAARTRAGKTAVQPDDAA